MRKHALVVATAFTLIFGLTACAAETTPGEESKDPASNVQESTSEDSNTSAETTTDSTAENSAMQNEDASANAPIDRASTPWNDDFPADFPLEDIPFPASGTFSYAELVEEDVWNVMLSDIPKEEHEAWLKTMDSMFKNMDEDGIYFIGKGASGTSYGIHGIVYDSTDTTVTIAYRITI